MSGLSTVHGERVLAACGGTVEHVGGVRRPVVECVLWSPLGVTSRLVPVTELVTV